MRCPDCQKNPFYHSFRNLGRSGDGRSILFSKPSEAVENSLTEGTIPKYIDHLNEVSEKGEWVWILDSRGFENLEVPSLSALHSIYSKLTDQISNTLKTIFIIHSNWKIELILTVCGPFISQETRNKICVIGSPLELLNHKIPLTAVRVCA